MTADVVAEIRRQHDFNSHARVGRDGLILIIPMIMHNFNSHARVGRDRGRLKILGVVKNFNSHARVGRDGAGRRG